MALILGAIADDFTGATDLASMLHEGGLSTAQLFGCPYGAAPEAEAVVIALKSRTAPVCEAVSESLSSLEWLLAAGARQIYFKYCSTFDSTADGNIGPVADALLARLGAELTVFCPAFPANGRTVYMGHLFVGDRLISETGMRSHPLTPMTDPDLVRVLQRQSSGRTGLVPLSVVRKGAKALGETLESLRVTGVRNAVVDAANNDDLRSLAIATADLPLITGGSGLAHGLPELYRARGLSTVRAAPQNFTPPAGRGVILAGSCSTATLAQVEAYRETGAPVRQLDPEVLAVDPAEEARVVTWAMEVMGRHAPLIYASASPDRLMEIQARMGPERAAMLVEAVLGRLAARLVDLGVRRLVVAGGETSGAIIQTLGIRELEIGPAIDPGVPWTLSRGERPLALALKSGNFGGVDFFTKAFRCLT